MPTTHLHDLKNNLLADDGANTIKPQTATSTVTGAAVDLVNGEGNAFAILHVGTVSGTTPTLDVKIQESDTSGGTYADITGATIAQVTASDKLRVINFKRTKRFCRAVGTIAGTTPSFAFSVAILGQKKST